MTNVLRVGLLLFVCLSGAAQAAGNSANEQRQVLRFCERFAEQTPGKLLHGRAARYVEHSAVTRQRRGDSVITFFSNFFQPSDSRFLGAWHCGFQIVLDGQTCRGEVSLPIAERRAFAEYTQWPRLMIVGDNAIVGADGDAAGYITPKYYKLDCTQG